MLPHVPSPGALPFAHIGEQSVARMTAIKEELEALIEVTFTASDLPRTFVLGMVVRFHRFGMNMYDQTQTFVKCTITLREDFSQVEDIKISGSLGDKDAVGLHQGLYREREQLIGTMDFPGFVKAVRATYPMICLRLHMLSNISSHARMRVETSPEDQAGSPIDFLSNYEHIRVRLDIPVEWPFYCHPIRILSCTDAVTGVELFSSETLDAISEAARQELENGSMLKAVFEGLWEAFRGEENATWWMVPADICYVHPSPSAMDAITLRKEDMETLKPGCMLGDKVVDTHLRIIRDDLQESAAKIVLLDSSFLNKVRDEMSSATGNNVQQLPAPSLQRISLFAKPSLDRMFSHRYLLLPFCDRSHWSLLLLVMGTGLVNGILHPKYIIHIDSLPGLHNKIVTYLRRFLSVAWVQQGWAPKAGQSRILPIFQPDQLPCINAKVPRQANDSNDGGVYVLGNALSIMKKPEEAVGLLLQRQSKDSAKLFGLRCILEARCILLEHLVLLAEAQSSEDSS